MTDRCPCGLGVSLDACCGRYLSGGSAPTAEALMRSRYSAFATGDAAYLRRSWHPATCPTQIGFVDGQVWTGLSIVDTSEGGMFDQAGTVTFVASYERAGRPGRMQEQSRFERVEGQWVYVEAV